MPLQQLYAAVIVLWAAWSAIWMLAANRAAPVRWKEAETATIVYRGPIVLAAFIMLFPPALLSTASTASIGFADPFLLIGAALLLAGFATSLWARRWLGRYWSGRVAEVHEHRLISSGPYSVVRHPIYSGVLLAFLGTALLLGGWRSAAALLVMAMALYVKVLREERLLLTLFGDDYAAYQRRVPALVPLLRRRTPRTEASASRASADFPAE
jgi:protein-S-isoprenylcysteine O-methyltransferase Ste14